MKKLPFINDKNFAKKPINRQKYIILDLFLKYIFILLSSLKKSILLNLEILTPIKNDIIIGIINEKYTSCPIKFNELSLILCISLLNNIRGKIK